MTCRAVVVLFVSVATVLCSSAAGLAQEMPASTYAALARTKPTWPPFYKPDPSDAKYAKLMARGACQVTGKRARLYYQSKLLDVNTQPAAGFKGTITEIRPGYLSAVDEQQTKSAILIVHADPAISAVRVQGKGSPEALQAGEFVRFVGEVDGDGAVQGAVHKLELVAPLRNEPIVAGRLQNLSGKIVRVEKGKLILLSNAERVQRLSLELADDLEIDVNLNDIHRASVGDTFTAQGRIYRQAADEPAFFFAEDLQIELAGELQAKPTQRTPLAAAGR